MIAYRIERMEHVGISSPSNTSSRKNKSKQATSLQSDDDGNGHNKLGSLSKDLFNRLPRLQKAYFYKNGLSHLELPHIPNLRYLDLRENKLTEFNLNNCPRLEHLDLNGNQLTEFQITPPAEGFNSSTKKQFPLRLLDLAYNKISVLRENHFELLGELEILDLSGNKFTTLKSAHFSGLTSLRHLSLESNYNMELKGHIFEALEQLETLDMSFIGPPFPPIWLTVWSSLRTEGGVTGQ